MTSEQVEGWTWYVEDAFVVHPADEPRVWKTPKYMTKTETDEPQLTTDEEVDLMNKEIDRSEGFDINFSLFRCLFNYHPVDFDDCEMVEEPETNLDLLKRLSQKSIENYNQESETKYEFVKVLYANYHMASSGVMFLITFQVKDPCVNLPEDFQARVRYSFVDESTFVFCRPKPEPEQEPEPEPEPEASTYDKDGDGVTETNVKKPRLE